MAKTGGDILIDALQDWGVDVIFGLPGDGINGIMEALRQRQDKIRFIQVRHEEAAAFMACAYAKYTGRLGVCLATSGPGGIHLLNGLYDAKMDGQPVLAITGHHFHDLIDTHAQQDVNLDQVFKDVAVYSTARHGTGARSKRRRSRLPQRVGPPRRGPHQFSRRLPVACRPTTAAKRNLPDHTSEVSRVQAPAACGARTCAEPPTLLNAGKKVAILAGRGALARPTNWSNWPSTLAAPIIKPLLGKACVPDDSPYTTGGIGLLGTKPSQEAIEEVRHAFHGRHFVPLHRVLPQAGQGPRRADRHRRRPHRSALSGRGRPGRR